MPRVSIRSNFAAKSKKVDSVSLREEAASLMGCLQEVEAAMKVKLVNRELSDVYPDIEVTLNEVDFVFLPDRLATRVKDGDTVGISVITMGGG